MGNIMVVEMVVVLVIIGDGDGGVTGGGGGRDNIGGGGGGDNSRGDGGGDGDGGASEVVVEVMEKVVMGWRDYFARLSLWRELYIGGTEGLLLMMVVKPLLFKVWFIDLWQ